MPEKAAKEDVAVDSRMVIWQALAKTDPKHTKAFKRSGGFQGTAIKPQWVIQRLTEYFGPIGVGWGVEEPQFQLVPAGDELLVFCTATCWHTKREHVLYGVGGDKVLAKNKYGLSTDDEAYKKAFTDAITNAFKFLGMGADVHLGQFDDNKYVAQLNEEFREAQPEPSNPDIALMIHLSDAVGGNQAQRICEGYKVSSFNELTPKQVTAVIARLKEKLAEKVAAEATPKTDFGDVLEDEIPY